jgi:ketosteroid isomerase-like protein
MDNWHQAAARADEKTFFSSMTPDAVYVGTDASERWLRDEMKEWSKEYFMRDSAWSFTPTSRNITLHENGDTAWFDELLDTWMGACRSTGIVEKVDDQWKIKYYHLSVAVPNDKINDYLSIIGKSR